MIPTPSWVTAQENKGFELGEKYIIKPVDEDGSVHITEESVMQAVSLKSLQDDWNCCLGRRNLCFPNDISRVGNSISL